MPFFVVPVPKISSASLSSHSSKILTYEAIAQLHFLQTIHHLVDVEYHMCPVRDEYPALGVQAMLLQRLEFLEEGRNVHNTPATDDVHARGVDEAGREDVEVVGDAVRDDGVSGIVAALGAAAQLGVVGEDIDELAFAFVAPLGAEYNGD
jgi:hypothetical protein